MNTTCRQLISVLLAAPAALLAGCHEPAPLTRVAGIVWVGCEPLFVARELGYFDRARLCLVERPSNTGSLMALASGQVEAAMQTLDESLIAREGGLDVRVILVFDESAGADVVMARPEVADLANLRGWRIGVEETAAGAPMLAKLLESANLAPADVVKVPISGDQQLAVWRNGAGDTLVSFEPYASQLERLGAHRLLDSSRFPGLIIDVLAARSEALRAAPANFQALVARHFRALVLLRDAPQEAARRMAPRLGLDPARVLAALEGVRWMDVASNRAWLAGSAPRLVG